MGGPEKLLRQIPPMDNLLEDPPIRQLVAQTSRDFVRDELTKYLQRLRVEARSAEPEKVERARKELASLPSSFHQAMALLLEPRLRRVVNATGVLIHTNLGRAPLSDEAAAAVRDIMVGY